MAVPSPPPKDAPLACRDTSPGSRCPLAPRAPPQGGLYRGGMSPPAVCPQRPCVSPGGLCHPTAHDPGHTCPPAMRVPSPVCPHRAASCSQRARLFVPGPAVFLEAACGDTITPTGRQRGGPDKQQCSAIGDLPRHVRCPQTRCHLWVTETGAASLTLPPAWPDPGRRWHRVKPCPQPVPSHGDTRTWGLRGIVPVFGPCCDPEVSWG